MAKIPFNIKYRPQIESGEFKVETRGGVQVKLLPINSHNARPIIGELELNGKTVYISTDENGSWTEGNGENQFDLFLITPEEELTEFEKKLWMIMKSEGSIIGPIEKFTDDDKRAFHFYSSELLTIARKEIVHNIADSGLDSLAHKIGYQKGFEAGKAEALKDLPRWEKKMIEKGQGMVDVSSLEKFDYIRINGYLMKIEDLEKLPGFKEDESHE